MSEYQSYFSRGVTEGVLTGRAKLASQFMNVQICPTIRFISQTSPTNSNSNLHKLIAKLNKSNYFFSGDLLGN